jgi:hypothetical protein
MEMEGTGRGGGDKHQVRRPVQRRVRRSTETDQAIGYAMAS